jgi:hypothetical protein
VRRAVRTRESELNEMLETEIELGERWKRYEYQTYAAGERRGAFSSLYLNWRMKSLASLCYDFGRVILMTAIARKHRMMIAMMLMKSMMMQGIQRTVGRPNHKRRPGRSFARFS